MPSRVPVEVPGGVEELRLRDVRGVDELVTGLDVTQPRVLLHLVADDPALGVEHGQTGAELVREAEQIELVTQLAVITTLGLGLGQEVGIEGFLVLPGGAVDALHTRVLLVSAPIGGTGLGQLEGRNVFGGRQVRPAAQVAPDPLAGVGVQVVVGGELRSPDLHHFGVVDARLVVDQFEFERLVRQFGAGFLDRRVDPAGEPLPGLHDLLHPLLERGQILGGERLLDEEIVVETVLDERPDAQFGLRELLLDGLRQDVRGGVPDDGTSILGVRRHSLDLGVRVRHPGQIAQLAVLVPHHHDRVGPVAREPGLAHRLRGGRARRNPHARSGGGMSDDGHDRTPLVFGTAPSRGGAGHEWWPVSTPMLVGADKRDFPRSPAGPGLSR